MNFLVILGAALVIVAICMLAMAVGVIFRNKPFRSCGNASITFQGEKIDCPACKDEPEDEVPSACCRVLEAANPVRKRKKIPAEPTTCCGR